MYYRLILEGGHMGAGNALDFVRYFRAQNPVDLYAMAARLPRVKGKEHGTGVKLIEKVSRSEYEKGRDDSNKSSYLTTWRRNRKGRKKHQARH